MRKHRRLLVMAIGIALLMTLFPPWRVRERRYRDDAFGPEYAGGYSFILAPPYATAEFGSWCEKYTTMVARLDCEQLLAQYFAVALGAGLVAGLASLFRNQETANQLQHGGDGTGWWEQNCPTFTSPFRRRRKQARRAVGSLARGERQTASSAQPMVYEVAKAPEQVEPGLKHEGKCQPPHSTGFRVSLVSLLLAISIAAFSALPDLFEPSVWRRISPSGVAGAFTGNLIVYLTIPGYVSYVVWKLRHRSMDSATVSFCALAVGLFVLHGELDRARMTTVGVVSTTPPAMQPRIIWDDEPAAVVAPKTATPMKPDSRRGIRLDQLLLQENQKGRSPG